MIDLKTNNNKFELILGSVSPRRKELLSNAGFDFVTMVSNADETVPAALSPAEAVKFIAGKKAEAVFNSFSYNNRLDKCIICADTVVAIDEVILGKPRDAADAYSMLRRLSGRTHTVYTGVNIMTHEKNTLFFVNTEVKFYELTDSDINSYIKSGEPFDKAGSYGIQAKGSLLVESIIGDYFNVMGLPISKTARELKKFGILPNSDITNSPLLTPSP